MKKKLFSLMMTLLLAFMGVARADELTVNDGTITNAYVPVYGFYADSYLKCEFVQPAADLAAMNGATINSVTFYASETSVNWGNANFQVFLTEVADASISAFAGPGTVVYEGALSIADGEMVVNFTTPYTYNGGNLLVGVYNTVTGSYVTSTWYGVNTTGASFQGYNYSSLSAVTGSQRNFLPKMTFDYTPAGGSQGGEEVVVEIGDGTGTTYYFPIDNYFNYSCTEQIYTAEEIGTAGTINAVSFYYNYGTAYTASNVTMYMKHVSRSEFASTSDCEALALGDIVWTGSIAPTAAGWYTFTLDTPFEYNGTDNLLVAFFDGTSGYSGTSYTWRQTTSPNSAYMALRYYSDSTTPDPYNLASYTGSKQTYTYRANIQMSITTGGEGGETYQNGLHTLAYIGVGAQEDQEEVIDTLIIERPNGAWMEPYHFNLYNDGTANVDVALIDFLHNNGYFSMAEGTEYPFTVQHNGRPGVDLYINTNTDWTSTDEINSMLAVNTTERSTHLYEIIATPYQPYCPDVWELAYNINDEINAANGINTPITWSNFMSEITDNPNGLDLHQNYDLPDYEENIPDGYDAVMKFTVSKAMMLNARVKEGYENGKVALYTDDFGGQPGPMADNNYTERPMQGGGIIPGGSGEVTVFDGEPQTTNYYIPVYGLWMDDYTRSEMIYPAVALSDLNGKDLTSMKFYISSSASGDWGAADFTIYMKEVAETTLSDYVGNAGATTVYTGSIDGTGDEMTINFSTPYHYNGGNLLIGFYQNVEGTYHGCYFYGQTVTGASASGYNSASASNASFNQRDFLPKTTFAYGNRSNRDAFLTEGFEDGAMPAGWTVEGDGTWTVGTGDYSSSTGAHTGNYNAMITHSSSGNVTYLVTPAMDLSNATSGTVNCWFVNRSWAGDIDEFGVYYRVNGGAWNELYSTTTAHSTWTEMGEIALTGFAANYQLGFKMYDDYGYGVGLDDIQVNITTAGGGQGGDDTPQSPVFSAGPVIEGLNILPGTYYLVASSTEEDYEVEIGINELPCPLDHALVVYPADNAEGLAPNSVTLKWQLSPYCTEYRLVFSSTYYPDDEENHPETVIVDWTSNLAEQYTVRNLYNNTNYFWRIDQRTNGGEENGGCTTLGDVWGFTTHLNIPLNLTVTPARIYEGETVTLNWNHILDRTYRSYRIYKDEELIYTTQPNQVVTSWEVPVSELDYNYPGTYVFNVTAVYDEGESDFSNDAVVTVGGYSATNGINGYVYEQDYETPIVGATVTITGTDALNNQTQVYTVETNANGYYEVQVYEGTYTSAIATMPGYQDAEPYQNGPTFYVGHNASHDNMNFMMDENFVAPAMVCAQPMYIPGVQGDTLVQIYWASPFGYSGEPFEAQIGNGTTTTGYHPFYTLYNYSISTALYTADELTEAGVTGAAMTSLSWYATNSIDEAQTGITIWMANTDATVAPATSPLATGMTKVYTGMLPANAPTGWTEFVFNEDSFAWDGQSNIMILVQRNCGDWTSSIQWQAHNPGFQAMSYLYTDNAPYNVETSTYTLTTSSTYRPNVIMKGGNRASERDMEMTRSLHHYNIYRTDCYNDGPYNSDNTEFLATAWVPDTSYFDVSWPAAEPGVYKFGVSAVYQGNRSVDYPWEERESEIVWSNTCGPCIDKDMQTDITVNVVCNSADSPEGTVVSFTNLNEGEQANYPQPSITLDGTGFQAINPFRKGDYLVRVYLPGYELIEVEESIWGHRDLRYVLTEIIYNVKNLYVSRTGWAMWDPETWEDYPIPAGGGASSIINFETGDFSQYAFDNAVSNYPWAIVQESQDGSYCMKSTNGGIASSISAIEASVNYTSAGLVSFDAQCQGEGSSTAWDKCIFSIDGVAQFTYGAHVSGWNAYTFDVAAGQHTFRWEYSKDGSVNPTGDCFKVDNINFNIGGTREGERHLEGFKVMCTSIDGEQIFNHNTPVDQPFCQLTTVDPWTGQPMLIEGEHYLVKVATIYSTGESDWCEPVEWVYEPCDHWGPVDEVTAATQPQGNHIEWVFEHGYNPYAPEGSGQQGGEASSFSIDFDGGLPEGWTNIDADGDGNVWVSSNNPGIYHNSGVDLTGTGHNSSTAYVISGSYANQTGQALTPDNYYVSPQITLGGTFSFWACAQDNNYAAEHFGVAVSTTGNTSGNDFTTINQWTLTAKAGGNTVSAGRNGITRAQGNWYQYFVDLSDYQGQTGYIAIRHFNCTDMFILNVDDVEMNAGRNVKGGELGIAEPYEMVGENLVFNLNTIMNYNERVFFLYNLYKDSRFDVVNAETAGRFIISADESYVDLDVEEAFNDFRNQNANQFGMMDKVEADNLAGQLKNELPAAFMQSLFTYDYIRSRENNMCELAAPVCSDSTYFFPAPVGSQTSESGPYYDCLYTQPRPVWYYFRIGDPGAIEIYMHSNPQIDIDFCCWGPFDDPVSPCPYGLTEDKVVDCSYSASWNETCNIPATAQTGEYYIMVITNYNGGETNITFSQVGGNGATDCGIVEPTDADILGFLITLDGEYLAFVGPEVREYDDLGEFADHEYCVRPIYPGLQQLPDSNFYFSMGCPVCANTNGDITCDPGDPLYYEYTDGQAQVRLYWEAEEPITPTEGDTWTYDFENSSMEGLQSIDADGDGYGWVLGTAIGGVYLVDGASLAGSGHNSSNDMICSGSYSNVVGALNPDNFLVFPQSAIVNGSTFSFWACAQDASYAAEHFSVAVSADGNAWTNVQEWTMTAKGTKSGVRDARAQGSWHQYSVDLSDYAGQDVFIAIRHFNCTDMFILDVDDVELSINRNRDGIIGYNIYRSENSVDYALIATVAGDVTEYFDAPGPGTFYYQVTALYDGCESAPAVNGNNPELNYVMVVVTGDGENTGLDENDLNVMLFPNPTKGNVTIQANGMNRITVVSVLGQVVYDTELDQDEFVLNMAQFNTGMYMVRIYTENGMAVKRVTVMH